MLKSVFSVCSFSVSLSWPLFHGTTLGSFSPLKQQAGFICAEEIGAKMKEVVLLTEEVRTLECKVEFQESVEDSFLKMSTRHPRVFVELPANIAEDNAEVRREERRLSPSPLTSHMLLSGPDETLLLEKTVVHSCLAGQELQQQSALSNYAEKRGGRRGDYTPPQKGDDHHMTHLLPQQKLPADVTVDTLTREDVLKIDYKDSAQVRTGPVATEAVRVETAAVLLVPTEDFPPGEAKLLSASAEDHRAQRNQPSQSPQERKSVFSLEAPSMKKTAPLEQKLKLSEEIWSSTTTTAVAAPSSGGQRRSGSTLDTEGQRLREGPQSGLSCSGPSHQLPSHLHMPCLLSFKSS